MLAMFGLSIITPTLSDRFFLMILSKMCINKSKTFVWLEGDKDAVKYQRKAVLRQF